MALETSFYSRRKEKRNRKTKLFLFIVFLLIIIYFLLSNFVFKSLKNNDIILSPLSNSIDMIKESMKSPLYEISEKELFMDNTTYGIYIKNLKTGEAFSYNGNQKFPTASLYKLWAMVAAFEKIEEGKLKENEVLEEEIAVLNEKFEIASEEAELTEGVAKKTVKEAIEKMITISDNYSAYLLISRIGISSLNNFLKEYGLSDSKTGSPPQTTAKDTALFFEKLYNKEFINEKYSDEMLALLKLQTLNDRIPKFLPENTQVAHKTGELEGVKHDVGIVFGKNQDYIIVILSEGQNPAITAEKIASFSKAVFDYFNK